jgi:type I restriction enzyme S subunit
MNSRISNLATEVRDVYIPNKEDDLPYIGLEHVEQESLHLSSIGSSQEVKSHKFRFKSGDILFGTLRPYFRKVIVAPCNGICSTEFCVVRANDPKDQQFVFYGMAQPQFIKYATTNSKGARPRTKWKLFSDFELPQFLPSQRRDIGDILSAYDDLIENNRRRIQLLEQAARLLYREWFVYLRFPGHEHVSSTDGVPEGWRRVPLQEVCKRITDGSHSSPRSIDEGFPMASVKDMHDWGFNIDQCRKISHQDFDLLVKNDCKPLKNDVLIAKDGSYLKHTFVVQEEIDFVILSSIAILRPNHLIDPHLLNFILRDPRTKMRMTGYVSGVALPRIILKEFRGFEILLPPVELQRLWAIHANPIAVQCYQLGKQNEALTKARDLLLPRLMNGEVVV